MKKQLPNLITLLNLLFGCAALLSLFQGWYLATAGWLAAAAAADFADGMVARALKVSSPVGKELDSLADAFSFGIVPGAIFYTLLVMGTFPTYANAMEGGIHWFAFPGFVLSAASAMRLARFNLDERQTEGFIGLATPACTIFVLGLLMLYREQIPWFLTLMESKWVMYGLIASLSYLLLAEIPMFSFKFKRLGWEGNGLRIIFAAAALAALVIWREVALAPIVLVYIVINVARKIMSPDGRTAI